MSPSSELVPVSEYAVVKQDTSQLLDTIRENMGNSGLSAFELPRVKIPAGGGKMWELPTLEGSEMVKSIDGVIVYFTEPRAYWTTNFDESGGGTPPDCSSQDGILGDGVFGVDSEAHPSGKCADCPMSKWGSDPRGGKGQACKQLRLCFVLQPDQLLPIAVFLPPTSIKPMKSFFLQLASNAVRYSHVVTSLQLGQTKGGPGGGITYSIVEPSMLEKLDDEAIVRIDQYAEAMRSILDTVQVTQADYADVQA